MRIIQHDIIEILIDNLHAHCMHADLTSGRSCKRNIINYVQCTVYSA